jgi:hypothetical protein
VEIAHVDLVVRGDKSSALFGQDQLVVAREAQAIFLTCMIDDELAIAREQSAAVDPSTVSRFEVAFGARRFLDRRRVGHWAPEHPDLLR